MDPGNRNQNLMIPLTFEEIMETCKYCDAEYRIWEPPANIRENNPELAGSGPLIIPTCHCLKERADRQYETHLNDERTARSQHKFLRLNLGNIDRVPQSVFDSKFVNHVMNTSADSRINVILFGDVGLGKTATLKALAYNFLSQGSNVRGGYVPELLSSFKDMDNLQERYEHLKNGDVLVLDDLDKLLGTRFEIEKLLSLVDWYTAKGRPVFVSMNTRPDKFVQKLSGNKYGVDATWARSLVDRLMGDAVVREFKGESFRLPQTGGPEV